MIEDLNSFAKSKGGTCLSKEYIYISSLYIWKCGNGHIWNKTFNSILNGSWCPECISTKSGREHKYSISYLQSFAEKKGGKFLSKEYSLTIDYALWECKVGHQWKAKINNVLNLKTWCPYCSGNLEKYSINDLIESAKKKGGKCISLKYFYVRTKYQWECIEGHHWIADWYQINKGSWCPTCANKRKGKKRVNNIESIRKIAEKLGGKVLSESFINRKTKMQFECNKGHQWFTLPYSVIYDRSWCPKCGYPKKLELKDIKDIAIKRSGICLSEEYINSRNKLKFQCSQGHTWMAQADRIKKGTWCPVCANKNTGLKRRGKTNKPKLKNSISE